MEAPTGYHQLRNTEPRDKVHHATAAAIHWAIVIGVLAALPCIIWLWQWAL